MCIALRHKKIRYKQLVTFIKKVKICDKVDIKEINALILSHHSDIAFMVCEKYKTEYDCWSYNPSACRLVVDLGALEAWDNEVECVGTCCVPTHLIRTC